MVIFSTKRAATDRGASDPATSSQLLIIGIGNSLRRDDGAGLALAAQLADYFNAAGIATKLMTATQLLPEMAADLAATDVSAVIFVDVAIHVQGSHFEISTVDIDSPTASTGHQLSPATLLIYASLLYGRSPLAWLVTIPGRDFDHGEGFSREVAQRLANLRPLAASLHTTLKEAQLCMN